METPSSSRILTSSQALAALSNSANSNAKSSREMEESEKSVTKSRQRSAKQDRSVLIDITNDSPIVGLARGSLNGTPLSSFSKERTYCKKTPGSGEALLRGQVKNLLQKVEEEAEISKFCLENCGPPLREGLDAIINSPGGLVAPTPVNTPLVLNFSAVEVESLSSVSETPFEDQLRLPQLMSGIDGKMQEESGAESEKELMISRILFLDFPEKSDSSSDCSSVVTALGTVGVERDIQEKAATMDDDDASIWSIQVNASTRGEDEDEDEDEVNQDIVDEGEVVENDEVGVGEEDEVLLLDELCVGISSISVDGVNKGPKFMGKHIRFVYDSDDELVEEFEKFDSPEIPRLKGLRPIPKGKHVRFQDDE